MRTGYVILLLYFSFHFASTQESSIPELRVGQLSGDIVLDGILDESDWQNAPLETNLFTTEPVEGAAPSGRTEFRVIASTKALIIGVDCHYADPNQIVSFSKLRDASLRSEDHVRVVIDPFLDGQSGYIFGVNANGARYDALVSNRGESENDDWNAVWEAVTSRHPQGWSVEIKIPVQSISFQKGLDQWAFNIERRIQSELETIRWANVKIDQWFIQTSRAGRLTDLPTFDYGLGLNLRPSAIMSASRTGTERTFVDFDPSLDIGQRIGPNIQTTLTINTDFAEAEVDTRQTNLTRFPLFFPERRSFFLEGSDIFEFGFGLGGRSRQLVPFFSRRIGLFEGEQVPIIVGGKINGRVGNTSFGGLVSKTQEFHGEENFLPASTMGVFRVKQNVFKESSIGVIGSFGDPQSRSGSFMGGVDFTYQTTRFRGDKNLIIGTWGMRTMREDLSSAQYAFGFKADYPNDLWDLSLTYMRIDDDFDPSLSFVQRKGIHFARIGATYAPRPKLSWLRQMRNQLFLTLYTDLKGDWQSYSIFTSPINLSLESGDRIEFKFNPKGERIDEAFEISEGVIIPSNRYHFIRYSFEGGLAAKRKVSGRLDLSVGAFYEGNLTEIEPRILWNPSSFINFEFTLQHNIGRLPFGDFDQTLLGTRVRFNITPDLQLNSFIQYDTDSKEVGLNARIHWIYHPQGDLFIVYNHNTLYNPERTEFLSNQFLIKARYNFRM
jgi:hypothetical protein